MEKAASGDPASPVFPEEACGQPTLPGGDGRGRYWSLKLAFLFSTKAVMPSLRSSVAKVE